MRGAVASSVADAIEGRPADAWTDEDLDAVRSAALEGGRLLRQIEVDARRLTARSTPLGSSADP